MTCRAADDLIQQSLDVPLSPPERARLDAHLAACPACRRSWDDHRAVSQAVGAWVRRPGPRELPPDEFTAQVMARLAPSPDPDSLWPRLRAAGMALALLVVLSPWVAPLLPSSVSWHWAWTLPSLKPWLVDLGDSLRAAPQMAISLWTAASGGLPGAHWAALSLAAALPVNALLCLRARRGGRRTA